MTRHDLDFEIALTRGRWHILLRASGIAHDSGALPPEEPGGTP